VICRIYFDLSFILQLGYTKKQEERHFRGVITLEVRTTVNTCMLSDLRLVILFPKLLGILFTVLNSIILDKAGQDA
jgi:hypothetical protein